MSDEPRSTPRVGTLARTLRSLRNRRRVIALRLRGWRFLLFNRSLVRGGKGLMLGRSVEIELYEGVRLGAYVHISDGAGIAIRPGARLRIGDGVFIGRHSVVVAAEAIEIGDRTLIAEHCSIRDGDHGLEATERRNEIALATTPIVIGDDAWIGAGARVLRGATIGEGAVVGANAVVREVVAAHTTVVGIPARVVKR